MQQSKTEMVTVIGMGLSRDDLTARHLNLISNADILIGGARHLNFFPESSAVKKNITKKLSELVEFIREQMHTSSIVVLASGDPLFYGIGSYLTRQLGEENIAIYPNISSIAGAFAKLKLPWHDADILSLHGRQLRDDLCSFFIGKSKVAILTDTVNTPAKIARRMLDCGLDDFSCTILENLGSEEESISKHSLQAMAEQSHSFSQPNIIVLLRQQQELPEKKIRQGMGEDTFEHDRGLITKAEVRVISIAKLKLEPDLVLWDLGAGCGSVAIEASQYLSRGRVLAVEKSVDRAAMITRNRTTHNVSNLEVICAELPEALTELPEADRVFIGGGGRDLETIIKQAAAKLKPFGIMVVNTVVIENMYAAMRAMESLAMQPDITQVQVSRSHGLPHGSMFKAHNPVWILTGTQPESEQRES